MIGLSIFVKDILFLKSYVFFEIVKLLHVAWKFNEGLHLLAKFSFDLDEKFWMVFFLPW